MFVDSSVWRLVAEISRLKMQMNPGSDVFDLSVKKLTIGRMAIIVFEQ